MKERNLTEQEAAEWLGVSKSGLAAIRKKGEGPAYTQIGKKIQYDLPDLKAFRAACRVSPDGSEPLPEATETPTTPTAETVESELF